MIPNESSVAPNRFRKVIKAGFNRVEKGQKSVLKVTWTPRIQGGSGPSLPSKHRRRPQEVRLGEVVARQGMSWSC